MAVTLTVWAKMRGVKVIAGFRRHLELRGNLDKPRRTVVDWDDLYRRYRETPIGG